MTIDRQAFRDWLREQPGPWKHDNYTPLADYLRSFAGSAVLDDWEGVHINGELIQKAALPDWAWQFRQDWAMADTLAEYAAEKPGSVSLALEVLDAIASCDRPACGHLVNPRSEDCPTDGEGHYFCCDSCAWQYDEAQLENCAAMKSAPRD